MHATGTLYLGKARPVADTAPDGELLGCVPSVAGFVLMILACLGCAALVIDFIEMALRA